MIDLRYHIVSIMAVFLALGIGIALGASVVSSPLESRLHDDLNDARTQRREAESRASTLRRERDELNERIESEIAPWALQGRLEGQSFVLVVDGSEAPDFREHVLDALVAAGARSQGTIALTERLRLAGPEDEVELLAAVRTVVPAFEPNDDVAASVLELLGGRFFDETGRALVEELSRARYLTAQGPGDTEWPQLGDAVVMITPSHPAPEDETVPEDAPVPGATAFADSVSEVAPTLIATDAPDGSSVAAELREDSGLSDMLVTFDASTNATDQGGLGVVAALAAAVQEQGGHYGLGRGLDFLPPPVPSE